MSTPQAQHPKGTRRSSRRPKSMQAGVSEPDHTVSDSGPSPSRPNYTSVATTNPPTQTSTERDGQRRKSQGKKTSNTPKPERTQPHQNAPSQPNSAYSSQRQATPIKQAYAGPTFHSSPAPSALPIPSFYSKSMPAVPSNKTPDIVEEVDTPAQPQTVTHDGAAVETEVATKRESTPLDFLFEAARQARETPQAGSPASRSVNLSVSGDSPLNRSPAPRESGSESVFPFELDGNVSQTSLLGPAFATPYKERINALRSASASPSTTPPILDKDERRIKSEALKNLLMNAHTQSPQPHSTSMYMTDMGNPFNARALDLRGTHQSDHQLRHRSGPSTPVPYPQPQGAPLNFPPISTTTYETRVNGSPMHRPGSSHLRRQYQVQNNEKPVELLPSISAQVAPVSTARQPLQHAQSPFQSQYQSINQSDPTLSRTGQVANHRSTHSTQQMEDDLRRVLKLDLTSRG